jgi:hypothetical protein
MKKYFIFLTVVAFVLVLAGNGCAQNKNIKSDKASEEQVETNEKADDNQAKDVEKKSDETVKDDVKATGAADVSKDDLDKLKKDIQSLQVQDLNALKN